MKRRFLNLACILLLLFAQHAAIAHAIWHASADGRHQQQGATCDDVCSGEQRQSNDSAQLCVFDAAFNQVLGSATGGTSAPMVCDAQADAVTTTLEHFRQARFLAPLSRGPPTLS